MNTVSRKNLLILSFTLLVVMLGYGMVSQSCPSTSSILGQVAQNLAG